MPRPYRNTVRRPSGGEARLVVEDVRMPAMPLVAGPRPPFGVRPIRSVVQVQLSSCPVSSPSSVRSSGPSSGRGCPAGWCPARPASSRLVSVRPVAAVSSRPPGGGDGDTSVRRAAVTTGSSRVRCGPAPFLAARSTARGGLDAGTAAEVVWRPAGGSVDRGPGPGGARAGGYGRPTRQAGPRRGRPVAGDCARAGELAGARLPHGTVWAASWPGAATTLRGRCGA
jgi:hypothetical protein